jgi:hypothetical protein
MKNLENQVLTALRNPKTLKKKRVTFFITEDVKASLAWWCKDNDVSESGAIEEMIRATVPARYFKK